MIARCPTCHQRIRRSNEANRRYWALLHAVAEGVKPEGSEYSAEVWHNYFKLKYLGGDDVRLPDGKVIVRPNSSAELDKSAFADYMTQIEAWANERGVFLDEMPA